MENGPPTIGFEDGTVDVEQLLVEPHAAEVSVDSVMCFNEKMSDKAMDISEVSNGFGIPWNQEVLTSLLKRLKTRNFFVQYGVTNAAIAHEGGDILNRDVLDSLHTEDDSGYFRLQNDFCSLGEEYLLGVGFAESITDLEYVSSSCLQTSVSGGPDLTCAGIDSPWKTDLFRIMEVPECQNEVFSLKSSEFGETPSPHHDSEKLDESKPLKSPDDNIVKVHHITCCSFDDASEENVTSFSQPVEMLSTKNEKNDEFRQISQNGESQSDSLPTRKRSRKPTKRYIEEVQDPILKNPKRRLEVPSSSSMTIRDKSVTVKDNKKCHMGSKAVKLPDEESAVKAIQVPFGSLMHKECPESPAYTTTRSSDRRHLMNKAKDNCVASENQKKRDGCTPVVNQMKRSDTIPTASQKKEDNVIGAHLTKSDQYTTAIQLTKTNESVMAESPKKKDKDVSGAHSTKSDHNLRTPSQRTRENTTSLKMKDERMTIRRRKRDDSPPIEASGRRKHHRLWTIAEVRKLIDGVSDYGVGRWSRIKKVFFSASAHRTSVDLKDKWRNLLKASSLQGQHTQQGEKKRNVAWRPLPKSILRRVCELSTMHPYPKEETGKINERIRHVSPDRGTDITLSDYRRILRSINGN